MKKFVSIMAVFMIIALFLSSCASWEDEIIYSEGVFDNRNFENIQFPIEIDIIKDEETAIAIAKSILNIERADFVVQSVFYDIEKDFYVVSCDEGVDNIAGYGFRFVLDGKTGGVIEMWVEE